MLQRRRCAEEIDRRAVAEISPKARAFDFHSHSVSGSLLILLKKGSGIDVGAHAAHISSRQQPLPIIGRACGKNCRDLTCGVRGMCGPWRGCSEARIHEQIQAVDSAAERQPFALEETGKKHPTLACLVETIECIKPVALLVGQL